MSLITKVKTWCDKHKHKGEPLASDGTGVIGGIDPPTDEERAHVAALEELNGDG